MVLVKRRVNDAKDMPPLWMQTHRVTHSHPVSNSRTTCLTAVRRLSNGLWSSSSWYEFLNIPRASPQCGLPWADKSGLV